MAFRFQKRIKLLPGVTVNIGKRGISASAGPRGAKITVGKTGTRATVGLPGTGISQTKMLGTAPAPETPRAEPENETQNLIIGIAFIAFLMFCAWVISKLF